MNVTRFVDEYDAVASVEEADPEDLRSRDERRDRVLRWVAWDGDVAVATGVGFERPDGRTFLRFFGQLDLVGPVAHVAVEDLCSSMYANVPAADVELHRALLGSGFDVEFTMEGFEVPFAAALARLRRGWLPEGYSIVSAGGADRDRLFALDNELREDVPGCDGWVGNREWFEDELDESPPFDPDGYLVMVDDSSGRYVGLVRVWRNPSGPKVGLVGTVADHRRAPFAAVLLGQALTAASGWGSDTFVTEASTANRVTYPALIRLGAHSIGRSHQMVRHFDR